MFVREQAAGHRVEEFFVEEKQVRRLTRFDEAINYEVDVHVSSIGEVEERIFSAFAESSDLAPWEMELKPEVKPGAGPTTRIEMRINQRIETFVNPPEKKRNRTIPRRTVTRIAVGVATAAFIIGAGVFGYYFLFERIPTFVCQTQGVDLALAGNSPVYNSNYTSRSGGAIRLINTHGYVQIQNGAILEVQELTRHKARYAIRLLGAKTAGFAGGTAMFFVTRHTADESFVVVTPEYAMEVMGTSFRCLPDMQGKVTTQVLEGVVIVNLAGRDTVYVKAGQSLCYDFTERHYRVEDGGAVAASVELGTMPQIKSLTSAGPLTINAGQPACDVVVDDLYKGITPIRLLVSPGWHRVVVSTEGCRTVDTAIDCSRSTGTDFTVAITKDLPLNPEASPSTVTGSLRHSAPDLAMAIPSDGAVVSGRRAEEMLARAQAVESADWPAAIRLYEYLGTTGASPRIKQAALYAIGRLQALTGRGNTQAADSFLRYLALYPAGLFSAEVLLSLAKVEADRDRNKALNYYLAFLDKYPLHSRASEALRKAGMIYIEKKRYNEAIVLLKQARVTMPVNNEPIEREIFDAIHRALIAKGDQNGARIFNEACRGG
jgi:TolA-binding protein